MKDYLRVEIVNRKEFEGVFMIPEQRCCFELELIDKVKDIFGNAVYFDGNVTMRVKSNTGVDVDVCFGCSGVRNDDEGNLIVSLMFLGAFL